MQSWSLLELGETRPMVSNSELSASHASKISTIVDRPGPTSLLFPTIPSSKDRAVAALDPDWESMLWPLGMMLPFVSFQRTLQNVAGAGKRGTHVCIMAGGDDKLVDVKVSEKLATLFRKALEGLKEEKKVDVYENPARDADERIINKSCASISHGVRLVILEEAPHHFQNDVHWDVGAKQLLAFIYQLP